MDRIDNIGHALARMDDNKLAAYADGDNILFLIKDAPDQLRELADKLEQIDVNQIQAIVAFKSPKSSESSEGPENS